MGLIYRLFHFRFLSLHIILYLSTSESYTEKTASPEFSKQERPSSIYPIAFDLWRTLSLVDHFGGQHEQHDRT